MKYKLNKNHFIKKSISIIISLLIGFTFMSDVAVLQANSTTYFIDSIKSDNEKIQDKNEKEVEYVFEDEYQTDRFIIKYKNDNNRKKFHKDMNEKIKTLKKIKESKNNKFDVIYLENKMETEDFFKELKKNKLDESIEYFQPDYELTIASDDPYFNSQWGIQNTEYYSSEQTSDIETSEVEGWNNFETYTIDAKVVPAWGQATGNGAVIAVLDTGIDITHEDLYENIWINSNEIPANGIDDDANGYIDDITGWDFAEDDNSVHSQETVYDEWHGTQIAGIIAAVKDNNRGIAGVAPSAKVLPLKVFENGTAYTSDIIEAIEYADAMGVRIANCSWGTISYNQALREAMEKSGMLFVTAAGNSGRDIEVNQIYPASFENDNIIAVAAINKYGSLSSFSNYGLAAVDVAAPGENILSTTPDNTYGQSSGTSMAAAFVSGEAALLMSKYPNMSINEIRERIIYASDRLSSLEGKVFNGYKINYSRAIDNIRIDDIINITEIAHSTVNSTVLEDNGYNLFSGGTWTTMRSIPTARYGLGVAEVNGKIYAIGGYYNNGYKNTVEEYDPTTNTWTTKASMPTARNNFGVAVANGKIYAIGGYNGSYLNKVEEYDPATDIWTTKTSMSSARTSLGAVAVNGKIYAIGGYNGSYLNKVEEYDPATDIWTTKTSMPTGRRGLGVTAVNGKIYAIGGYKAYSYLNTVEEYNPATNSWVTKTNMSSIRQDFGIAEVNGKIYAIGGYNGNSYLNTVEEYDPALDLWALKTQMPTARAALGVATINSELYAISGRYNSYSYYQVEKYTPGQLDIPSNTANLSFTTASNKIDVKWYSIIDAQTYEIEVDGVIIDNGNSTAFSHVNLLQSTTHTYRVRAKNSSGYGDWSTLNNISTLPEPPANIIATPSDTFITVTWDNVERATAYEIEVDGLIINAGASTAYTHSGLTKNIAHKYRVRTKNSSATSIWSSQVTMLTSDSDWMIKSNMPTSRSELSVIAIYDKVYAIGGYNGGYLGNVEEYNPETNSWIARTNMPYPSKSMGVSAVNDKIYAIGGYNGSYLNRIREYNPTTYSWTVKTNMPTGRQGLGVSAVNEKIYAIGGYNGGYLNKVEEYNPATNTWGTKNSMPTARQNFGIATVNGKIYAIGGYNGSYLSTVEEYDSATDTWVAKTNMPTARHSLSLAVLEGKIYAIGGYTLDGTFKTLNTVEVYDPELDEWTLGVSMPTERRLFGVAVVDNKLYAIGGYGSGYLNTVEEFAVALKEPPTTPVNLYVQATSSTITLQWDEVVGAKSYELEVDGIIIDNGQSNIYMHDSLVGGSVHSYRVRAKNEAGSSEWSNILSKTTILDVPSNISLASNDEASIDLSWSSVNGAATYEIEVDDILTDNVGSTSCTHHGLTKDNKYSFRVRAKNSNTVSEWSEKIYGCTKGSSWIYWSDMTEQIAYHGAEEVNGKIYIFGGIGGSSGASTVEYDPLTNTYKEKSYMPFSRQKFGTAEVNGKIYIIGGKGNYNGEYCFNYVNMYDPETDTWTAKASMPTARHSFGTAVVNGKIYIIGGIYWNNAHLSTVEEYDPDTDTWTTKAYMPTARSGLSLAVLNDKIYAIGGYNGDYLQKVEEYDPVSNTWTTKANMVEARSMHAAVSLDDKIYAIGGYKGSYLSTVEEYDPNLDKWIPKANMIAPREGHAAVAYNGKIYTLGGIKAGYLSRVDVFMPNALGTPDIPLNSQAYAGYDYVRLTWNSANNAYSYEIEADGVVISDTDAITFTQNGLDRGSIHTYRIRSKNPLGVSEWSAPVTLSTSFYQPSFNYALPTETSINLYWNLVNNASNYEIMMNPGQQIDMSTTNSISYNNLSRKVQYTFYVRAKNEYTASEWSNPIYVYFDGERWKIKNNLSSIMKDPGLIEVNGKIYSIGGSQYQNGSYVATNEVKVYNPTTDTWTSKASLLTAKEDFGIAALNNKVYVIGGYPSSEIQEYNIADDIWLKKSNMPTSFVYTKAATIGSKIYILGTYTDATSNKVYEYDPISQIYTEKASMPTNRTDYAIAVVNDKIYAIGGYKSNGFWTDLVEEYDPATNTWTTKASMPTTRGRMGIAVLYNKIYAIGGNYGDQIYNIVEKYDPYLDKWEPVSSMPTPRSSLSAVTLEGEIYTIGGSTVEVYSPEKSTYTIDSNTDKSFQFAISLANSKDYKGKSFVISYNTNEVEVEDLYAPTLEKDLTEGDIVGTNISIVRFAPGVIEFNVNKDIGDNITWTGIVNIIKFKSKIDGTVTIDYLIE